MWDAGHRSTDMTRRVFNLVKVTALWVVLFSAAVVGVAMCFRLPVNGLVVGAGAVFAAFYLGCLCWGALDEARMTWWSWRWWWWFRRTGKRLVIRDARRSRGLCPGCAYDLTGNESGVCPECGEERRVLEPEG
jgi:hypothetical protein